ncbi:hypothetical protein QVD17_24451 [Tagetes erecta]|uniref:Uncharacterized protein n=1 Tax=Tagetes erecta TaxID=13708 RepID=A0AAD8KF46_TARER|nr:hypothetical protein QVD17_24451 [Tagetes erecta]
MEDLNVESSSLARKLLKIDGNPRVNLLRGSSKRNDASKTNPSSRHPIRGAAVISNMMINPKVNDHTANVLGDPANVDVHTARVDLHTAKGNAQEYNGLLDTANVRAHTAGHDADTANACMAGVDTHTAIAYTAKGNINNGHEADTANAYMDGVDNHTANAYTAKGDINNDTANSHTASVNQQMTDMARVMVDNDYMEKASDDTTSLIHESNAGDKVASLDEERFLKQKSKVHWLAEGDANTKYFHNTLKCRNHRARIDVITDSNGVLHEGKAVPKAFVDHYVGFLGKEEAAIIPITQELLDVRIDQAMSVDMIREIE